MPDLDGLGVLGAPARGRPRDPGDRADRAWRHRQRGVGDARGRRRFRGQAGRRRAAAGDAAQRARHQARSRAKFNRIKRSRSGTLTFKDIVTRSARMHAVLRNAEKAAGSDIPVLIEGQSGVGKELIARAIHGSGERASRSRSSRSIAGRSRRISSNRSCSGTRRAPSPARPSATPASSSKRIGGTLFLDEVGELPLAAQVKLLRAIQEGEVEPVGARKPVKVDVRLISATNRDLIADVKDGRFREDLFYRLHVFPITRAAAGRAPRGHPRARPAFPRALRRRGGQAHPRASAARRWRCSASYRWPGNVRQLENAVFRAVVLAEGDEHRRRRIPADRRPVAATSPARCPATPSVPSPTTVPAAPAERSPSGAADGARAEVAAPRPSCPEHAAGAARRRTARCARWKRSRPRSSASRSRIIAGRCRRSRAGCGSAARRSTASSMLSGCSSARPKTIRPPVIAG